MNQQVSRSLHVAVVQAAPVSRSLQDNTQIVLQYLQDYATRADIVVFPELFLSGYQIHDLEPVSVHQEHTAIQKLREQCKQSEIAVLFGAVEITSDGFYNVMIAIDKDGENVSFVRKTHLFGPEKQAFLSGNKLAPIRVCGVNVGVINCFEIEFPEIARTLALQGAEIFLAGSANMHPYTREHRLGTRARVFENNLPFAYANRVGAESGHNFCGYSNLISADGQLLHEADSFSEQVLFAELELGYTSPSATDMIPQRRPELYH